MMTTNMREKMLDEDRGKELQMLIVSARALQAELLDKPSG